MDRELGGDGARTPRLDRAALARTLRRLCASPQPPWLHAEAARRMAERLPLVRLRPAQVLDWSGVLGASTSLLRQAYPQAKLRTVALPGQAGPAPDTGWRRRWPWARDRERAQEVAQAEVAEASCELLWSNMLLHASEVPQLLLAQWRRAVAVDGFVMFSTLGPGSLPELRALYRAQGWGEPMAAFVDMHDLGDQLLRAGFADPVMDQELLTLTWPDAGALLRELRGLGANLCPGRHAGLRTPRWHQRLLHALAATAASPGGRPQLSFELVYGHAFKAAARAPVRTTRIKP